MSKTHSVNHKPYRIIHVNTGVVNIYNKRKACSDIMIIFSAEILVVVMGLSAS